MKHLYIAVILLLIFPFRDLQAQWVPSTLEGASDIDDIIEYKDHIYVAFPAGIYRSGDNGTTWEELGVPPLSYKAYFVVINDELHVVSAERSYRSSDGINFIQTAGVGAGVTTVTTDGTTLLAGGVGGIYISTDQGDTWSHLHDVNSYGSGIIASLAIKGSVIHASDYTDPTTLFRSTDLGATWEQQTISNYVHNFAYQGSTLFMNVYNDGIYRSNDDGASWERVRQHDQIGGMSVTPTQVYHVGSGVYSVSADQGDSWVEIADTPPHAPNLRSLYVGASYAFSAVRGVGMYRKPLDNSEPWSTCNHGLNLFQILDFDIKEDHILAGAEWAFIISSTDGGQTWTRSAEEYDNLRAHHIVRMDADIFLLSTPFIYRSSDDGSTWQKVSDPVPGGFPHILGASNGKLYTQVNTDIYVSSDRGESWIKSSEGVTGQARSMYASDKTFYLGTYDGLLKLSDDEQRWEKIELGSTPVVNQIAELGNILLIGTNNGILKSEDEGQTWTLIHNADIYSLVVRNHEIFATNTSGAVYHSLDTGATWSDITENLPHSGIIAKIGFTSKHLVAANGLRGLWLRDIGEVSPPYFSLPSTESDTPLPTDAPIVITVDQPIQTLDGTPISPGDVKDLITVTETDGTPVDYTATLEENLTDITVTIENAEPDTEYRITIAPVSNEEGLQTKSFTYVLRTAANAPPTGNNLSIETLKNTPYQFTAEDFTDGYSDPEGAPLNSIKVLALPGHGTLTLGGGAVALDAEISLAQLSDLTYTPSVDFVGTDQWQFAVSDGNSHSDHATVTISITPITGIADEESLWAITYHPNPVVDKLIIHNPGRRNIEWLSIMDVNGRPISLPQEKGGGTITIDFAGVPAGLYVMAIQFEGKLHYRRLVVGGLVSAGR